MLIRQLFDHQTYTYTYLLADTNTTEALLIDPVIDHLDSYIRLLTELNLELKMAIDTHVHADHVTALGKLREVTQCKTYLGVENEVQCSDSALSDNQILKIGKYELQVIYTPGHTDNSFCFYLDSGDNRYLFSGDTLLIRGTGRTDFQNGNPLDLYNSIHNKLLTLPANTIVYPGHDYKGWTSSNIEEEKNHNPRLQIHPIEKFKAHMDQLNLPNPKFMDVAVPANLACGAKDSSK